VSALVSLLAACAASEPELTLRPTWRGKAFYICARFRAPSRRPEDDSIVRHTRMALTGFGRFELAYLRHTGRWFTIYRGLTAAACFEEIESNGIFWPV
jgi:hypothetical protein